MPAVGIDISDNSVRFIELLDTQYGKVPGKYGEHPIPDGAVLNGEVQNVEKLSKALKALKEKYDLTFIHASLPEEKVYLFRTQVPNSAADDDIHNILEFKLEENVPLSPQEAIFDYDILPEHDDNSDHIDVEVAVYPKQTVMRYTEAFHTAGFFPLAFEIEAQAIARSVIKEGDDGTYMIVDFGNTRTGVAIVHQKVLSLTSTLEIEEQELTNSIMKHLHVSKQEAEHIKNEKGLIKNRENKELFSSLMSVSSALKDNIQKYYGYWKTRVDDRNKHVTPIEKIILCGGNANLAGLPEYLAGSLKIPVERGNVWMNTFSFDDVVPDIDRHHSLSYATAIGLALRRGN